MEARANSKVPGIGYIYNFDHQHRERAKKIAVSNKKLLCSKQTGTGTGINILKRKLKH